MAKQVRGLSEALYPVPVVLVTAAKPGGGANIITLAWVGIVCSDPPSISISIRPSRYSHGLIKEAGEFVINVPTEDILRETDRCGMVSGRDVDKFKECSFTAEKATVVGAPLIKECPVSIECKTRQVLSLGAHDLFIGEVVAVHADDKILDGGRIDYARARPVVFNQGEYWNLAKKIGTYGSSAR